MRYPILLVLWAAAVCGAPSPPPFLVAPYLQYDGRLLVLWHAPEDGAKWEFTYSSGGSIWKEAKVSSTLVSVRTMMRYRIHQVEVDQLRGGFDYRVSRDSALVFAARGGGWKSRGEPTRFTIVGDTGSGSSGEKAIVYQMHQAKPDYLFIPGDIVYEYGRASEYRRKFYPVYNADEASPLTGAPLLRSTVSLAAPGNHDVAESLDLGSKPDALAYFLFWAQPMNGFDFSPPPIKGPAADQQAFREASGGKFPKTANFSFNAGDVHWIVIDSNPYMSWKDPRLREWLVKEMETAKAAPWKFVALHSPPFHSSGKHQEQQQQIRVLAPLFESGGIDMVWTGHVHNYQRSHPLRGEAIDRQFDGLKKTKAGGVIYMVTGAGGARLVREGRDGRPDRWKPFTARYFGADYSFSLVEVTAGKVEVRQIDAKGKEQDRFVLTH